MDLKKFKKLTNDKVKVNKIVPYDFSGVFNHLLVTKVLNYYTLEVVIYNNKMVNKWQFYLNDVNTLDDKLSSENKEYLRNKLVNLCLNRYFRFKIIKAKFREILGNIFFEDKDMQINTSVNTMMINMTINLIILKEKLIKNGSNGKISSPLKKSFTIEPTPLATIKEEEEFDDLFDCEI